MRIGLIAQLHGSPEGERPPPTWSSVRDLALTAERIGFDSFVFEDALLYRGETTTAGCWEAASIAAALAVATTRIEIGPSVFNAPYRSPALLAKIAETIDEISDGRFIFGVGAGNTPDDDYRAFGHPTDKRYSRFAEAIQIVHGLMKQGAVDFAGDYHSARDAEMVLRGPRPGGPPIVIAAGGPKMLRLTARYGDAWNWWTATPATAVEDLRLLVAEVDNACAEVGRDPGTLRRTLDLYTVDPLGRAGDEDFGIGRPLSGSPVEIASVMRDLAALGFDEVRCDVYPKSQEAVEAMGPIVDLVH